MRAEKGTDYQERTLMVATVIVTLIMLVFLFIKGMRAWARKCIKHHERDIHV